MSISHLAGALIIFLIILLVSLRAGKKISSFSDFENAGRKAGSGMVAGALAGTLVGGASTVGTSQLAFSYGLSAWWFTLGGGISLLILERFYLKALYQENITTIPQLISREYGKKTGIIMALLGVVGTYMSIVSQVMSGLALIGSVGGVSSVVALIITLSLMLVYVLFGGALSVSYIGIAKTALIILVVLSCGGITIIHSGGLRQLLRSEFLPAQVYLNFFSRGFAIDLGAVFSMIVGVLTTQAYVSAVLSAKTIRVSRRGIYLTSLLVPLIGASGILVGLFMRVNHPDIKAQHALSLFITQYLPAVPAGAALAVLLIGIVGSGAGLALSVSTILTGDVYAQIRRTDSTDKNRVLLNRLIIIIVLGTAGLISLSNMGGLILNWSFLSMGLRGAAAIGVFNAALFLKGKVRPAFAIGSMLGGVLASLLGKLLMPDNPNPVIMGVGASLLITALGTLCFPKINHKKR